MIKRGYKFRIYPNKEQEIQLKKTIGSCRFVYNWGLQQRRDSFLNEKINLFNSDLSERLTQIKRSSENIWLKNVSSVALQQSLSNLDFAFTNFFKKRGKFPRFKSKRSGGSARFVRTAFRVKKDLFYIAKIKTPIKVAWSRELPSIPSSCSVSQNPSGQWFVSFTCEVMVVPYSKTDKRIGIDLGVESFATFSDGAKVSQPNSIRKLRHNLARANRNHSRKKLGSRNSEKARIKVARVHQKISNIRNDFLHKLSSQLVRENQVIAVEDLVVSDMTKKAPKKLARLIGEQGWYYFRRMLEYKAEGYGRKFVVIDRFFPSSKTCSCCGKQTELTLKDRVWSCACGVTHDRDINAAKNILAVGTTVTACGTDVRLPRKRSVVKQEILLERAR